ncbi:MAG: hypothetical protein RLZZ61_1338 [Pseudomonadota bacterium]|jgi:hypothetical protein
MKPRAVKAAEQGRSGTPIGLVFGVRYYRQSFRAILPLQFFGRIPSCHAEAARLQNEHARRCFCGVSEEPNCLKENLK